MTKAISIQTLKPTSQVVQTPGVVILISHDRKGYIILNDKQFLFKDSNIFMVGYNEQFELRFNSIAQPLTKISLAPSFFSMEVLQAIDIPDEHARKLLYLLAFDSSSHEHAMFNVPKDSFVFGLLRHLSVIANDESVLSQRETISGILMMLMELIKLPHKIKSSGTQRGEIDVVQICQYIESNYRSVSLHELSNVFRYSPNYLSQVLKKTTNHGFSTLVYLVRINNACRLMRNSSRATINEIANKVGYSNINSFYRHFRRFTGMSPRSWHHFNE